MADEYIKRYDAEQCAEKIINQPTESGFKDSVEILSAIHYLPATDAVPVVRGRWVDSELDGVPSHCSECNYPIDRFYKLTSAPTAARICGRRAMLRIVVEITGEVDDAQSRPACKKHYEPKEVGGGGAGNPAV